MGNWRSFYHVDQPPLRWHEASMNDTRAVSVCIVGAGPVGATQAATLAARGVPVALLDHQPLPPMEMPAFDGRAYAIALASQRLLDEAGVWQHLPHAPGAIRQIRVADGRPGQPASPLRLHFDAAEVSDEPFGYMVEARSLRIALNRALVPAQVLAPVEISSVERTTAGAAVTLADGRVLRAALVVAAEGRQSPLRRAAGIAVTRLDYHQTAMVGAFAHEQPHHEVALEQFLPNGPFAQLPLATAADFGGGEHQHASAFVWADRHPIAERMLALDDAAFSRELARRLGDHLGAVRVIGRRWSYPLSALHVARWVDTRLALVGDAAHGVHPIAGQGLNLGFRDVAALAELLAEAHARGEDLGAPALLARYQARRRPDTLAMLLGMHALERLFSNDIAPVRLARRLGIAAVDRIPALKRAFARQAMGLGVVPAA
jgi:2-octaprenyl-6-methoxyphenol hydroxylase